MVLLVIVSGILLMRDKDERFIRLSNSIEIMLNKIKWIINDKGEILIQKRPNNFKFAPGKWAIAKWI